MDGIRAKDQSPGLQPYEVALLRLVELVTNGCGRRREGPGVAGARPPAAGRRRCAPPRRRPRLSGPAPLCVVCVSLSVSLAPRRSVVEIDVTGTRMRYKPGVVVGGGGLRHECGNGRALGYYLEVLVVLGLFGKRPLSITLTGVTNDDADASVDTFKAATVPLMKRAGVGDGLELRVVRRGVAPDGGGEVHLHVPTVKALATLDWRDEGLIKRVRGVVFTSRVAPQTAGRMVDAARGVLNKLLPDVYIFTDHAGGGAGGTSPGFGLSLVAETTSGCVLSADGATSRAEGAALAKAGEDDGESDGAAGGRQLPEDVGTRVTVALLEEVARGGTVDGAHQVLALLLAALGPEELSTVRLGPLTKPAVQFLRLLKEAMGVTFNLRAEKGSSTVFATVVGLGVRNVARRAT